MSEKSKKFKNSKKLKKIRIPIYGEVTKHKIAELHRNYVDPELKENEHAIGIHYDIYHGANGA